MKKRVDDGYRHNTVLYVALRPIILLLAKVLVNPRIAGKENIPSGGGYIIACNHIHAFDPIALIYSNKRIIHFLAKIELFREIMKPFYLSFGTIPVDRSKKNPLAVGLAEEYLKEGKVVGIFPEGTRNKNMNGLLPFKYGAVKMAQDAGCKIIPCALVGNYKFFRKSIKIIYGEALDVSDMSLDEANDLLKQKISLLFEDK